MDSQSIAYIIVWIVIIGAFIVGMAIFRGFIQWLLGTSEIIELLKRQNHLLEVISTERSRIISKTAVPYDQSRNPATGTNAPPAGRQAPKQSA
jgi:hypothetical protein